MTIIRNRNIRLGSVGNATTAIAVLASTPAVAAALASIAHTQFVIKDPAVEQGELASWAMAP
jgi:hypothetical protein